MSARECVTHHHACDCREAEFAAIAKERDALRLALEGIRDSTFRSAIVLRGMADFALTARGEA